MRKTKPIFSVTIKDCDVQTFAVGGHGGSGKDTSNTGVRVVHRESGAAGRATESRSQLENKRTAFSRMAATPTFRNWAKVKVAEVTGAKKPANIEWLVDREMLPKNLKVEGVDKDGNWYELDEGQEA